MYLCREFEYASLLPCVFVSRVRVHIPASLCICVESSSTHPRFPTCLRRENSSAHPCFLCLCRDFEYLSLLPCVFMLRVRVLIPASLCVYVESSSTHPCFLVCLCWELKLRIPASLCVCVESSSTHSCFPVCLCRELEFSVTAIMPAMSSSIKAKITCYSAPSLSCSKEVNERCLLNLFIYFMADCSVVQYCYRCGRRGYEFRVGPSKHSVVFATMFFRSCVVQALNHGNGSRHWLHASGNIASVTIFW